MAEPVDADNDAPPLASLMISVLGKEEPLHALGEFTADTYPPALADALRRRNQVAGELRGMQIATPAGRHKSAERLVELLKIYPHPMAYDALILAYVDQRRWDDARGVAFAARERRWEVERSPWPEIRSEIDRLKAWSVEDVDDLRREAAGELVTPGVTQTAVTFQSAPIAEVTPALG
jgi:hypothetical protein